MNTYACVVTMTTANSLNYRMTVHSVTKYNRGIVNVVELVDLLGHVELLAAKSCISFRLYFCELQAQCLLRTLRGIFEP
jgi:hypothetical protein